MSDLVSRIIDAVVLHPVVCSRGFITKSERDEIAPSVRKIIFEAAQAELAECKEKA